MLLKSVSENTWHFFKAAGLVFFLSFSTISITGCASGPMEEAGEEIDDAADEIEDAVD